MVDVVVSTLARDQGASASPGKMFYLNISYKF